MAAGLGGGPVRRATRSAAGDVMDRDDHELGALLLLARDGWLDARALAAAAAVCRDWRRLLRHDDTSWRAALLRHLAAQQGLASATTTLRTLRLYSDLSWYSECVRACGIWRRRGVVGEAGSGAAVACICFSKSGRRLISGDESGVVRSWKRQADGGWQLVWGCSMRSHGWAAVADVQCSASGGRLLVSGPVALTSRWELAVLGRAGRVLVRAGCGVGGAAGWAGSSLVALDSPRLVPPHALTPVWLYATTQKTRSEHDGVASPLLYIFNESAAHISHAIIMDVSDEIENQSSTNVDALYYDLVLGRNLEKNASGSRHMLVWASGGTEAEGAARGVCTSLAALRVQARTPPPLHAAGTLAERRAIAREQRQRGEGEERQGEGHHEEVAVRALCTAPDARLPVHGRVVGIAAKNRCAFVSVVPESGGTMLVVVAVPELRAVRVLQAPGGVTAPYRVRGSAGCELAGSPAGDGSGHVWLWSTPSATRLAPLRHPHAPVALLLASAEGQHEALVAAGSDIHVWQSSFVDRVSRDSDMDERYSPDSDYVEDFEMSPPPCPPCAPAAPPRCRAKTRAARVEREVVCRPPPRGLRPPCAPPLSACSRDCDTHADRTKYHENKPEMKNSDHHGECDVARNIVASRMKAEESKRREDYEREQKQRSVAVTSPPVQSRGTESPHADEGCRPRAGLDYCAHTPRQRVRIHRQEQVSDDNNKISGKTKDNSAASAETVCSIEKTPKSTCKKENLKNSCDQVTSECTKTENTKKGLTSRIMESLSRNRNALKSNAGTECARPPRNPPCEKGSVQAGNSDWCSNLPPPANPPQQCRQPPLVEKLRRRMPPPACGPRRNIHSVPGDRHPLSPSLKESGRGRDLPRHQTSAARRLVGRLELLMPAGDRDRMRLQLELDNNLLAFNRDEDVCSSGKAPQNTGTAQNKQQIPSQNVCCPSSVTSVKPPPTAPTEGTSDGKPGSAGDEKQQKSWFQIKSLQKKLSNSRVQPSPAEQPAAGTASNKSLCPRRSPEKPPPGKPSCK